MTENIYFVFLSVPSILPTNSVAVLWMLGEGDVDTNQRRAVLQHDATPDHCYPTSKYTGSRERA